MGSAVRVDWEQAKLLRFEGFTFREIAERLGCKENTLTTKAYREQWRVKIAEVKSVVASEVQNKVNLTLQERAQRFTAALANDVDTTLAHVAQKEKPGGWDDLVKRETVMEKLTKRGRSTYGLDQAGPHTVVNVAILSDVSSNQATDVQAIDVQEVKEESPD